MDRPASERPSARLPHVAVLTIVLGITALAYVPALRGEPQFDDDLHVPRAHSVSWRDFLPPDLLGRPLTTATFALNRATTGLAPVPLHATNVLVHLVVAVLAWLLLRRTLQEAAHPRAEELATVVAGTFALHPVQSEAVAYVVQRAEALSAALSLAAVLLMLRAERLWGSRGGWIAWGWAGIVFVAAIAAKPNGIATPIAYLAHRALIAPSGARPHAWRQRIVIAGPFIAVVAVVSTAFLYALRHSADAGINAGQLGPWRYLLTQASVILRYIRLLAVPTGQTIEHSVRPSPGLLDGTTIVSVAAIASLVATAAVVFRIYALRRSPSGESAAARIASFGVAWFLVWLAPTSSVIPLADPMFEHRVYLASLGAFASMAVAVDLLASRVGDVLGRRILFASVATVWVVLGVLTYSRASVWSRADALWTEATLRSPGSQRAHWNLGSALDRRGDLHGALASFRRAEAAGVTASAPYHPALHQNIATVLRRLGRPGEAREVIERALTRAPSNPSLHDDLAILLLEAGNLEKAALHAREAIGLAPRHAPYWETLAEIARERSDPAGQAFALRRAAALDPQYPDRDVELAELEATLGHVRGACAAWRRVIRWTHDDAQRSRAIQERLALDCIDR